MKELSIEEKAIAYDKAIAVAKHIHKFSSDPAEIKRIEQIFPELKENEDEEIRKEIIEQINLLKSATLSDLKVNQFNSWISWLKKQGEQNPTDKDKPKFHEGDWVVTSYGKVNQVIAVDKDGDGYTLDDDTYFSGSWCDMYHLWTIQDAKDGDVLICKDNQHPFIFKGLLDTRYPNCPVAYCGISSDGTFDTSSNDYLWTDKEIEPATKEQCDLLFTKIKEAGYEWDAEKKELKEIIDENQIKKNLQDNSFRRMFEQKQICSEEQRGKESLSEIENRIINFAMQFHDNRMKPESEWEDEVKMLRDIIPFIHKTS